MAAIANSPSFAKKVGIPQSVGKDFNEADKGRKFSKGGDTMASKMNPGFMAMIAKKKDGKAEGGKADMKQDKSMMQKAVNKHEGRLHKGSTMTKLAGGGTFRKDANGVAQRGLTKGKQVTMKKGGMC
jgi:hypothetical protein